ncbi:MAG TPA: hypothetical protein VFQ52_02240, partial [Rhizomicrobium sp.]|nr:hypothetical protein [Rhizomicrobium sp.]
SSEAGRAAAQKKLGDALAVEDAREMGLLLSAGPQIQKIQEILHKPTASFTENLIWDVRAVYDGLLESHPDVAPYVAVIAMNRLAKPWEALRLPMLITRHTDDTLIAKTDMGLVGEILFTRMDTLKTSIQRTRHPLFDAEILMEEVRVFAGLSSHIVKEIELKRGGEWGKRLLDERALIGQVMETFMDRAPKEFAAALPTQKAAGADFSKPVSAEKREMALRYVRLVSGSRDFAAAASFAAKQKAIFDALCTALQRYNENLVNALKAADPARAEIVQAQLEFCAQLTVILFGKEDAELLRRRAKAAAA